MRITGVFLDSGDRSLIKFRDLVRPGFCYFMLVGETWAGVGRGTVRGCAPHLAAIRAAATSHRKHAGPREAGNVTFRFCFEISISVGFRTTALAVQFRVRLSSTTSTQMMSVREIRSKIKRRIGASLPDRLVRFVARAMDVTLWIDSTDFPLARLKGLGTKS